MADEGFGSTHDYYSTGEGWLVLCRCLQHFHDCEQSYRTDEVAVAHQHTGLTYAEACFLCTVISMAEGTVWPRESTETAIQRSFRHKSHDLLIVYIHRAATGTEKLLDNTLSQSYAHTVCCVVTNQGWFLSQELWYYIHIQQKHLFKKLGSNEVELRVTRSECNGKVQSKDSILQITLLGQKEGLGQMSFVAKLV